MCKEFPQYQTIWQELYFKGGKKIGGYIYLVQGLRRKLIEEVRTAARDAGLEFSSCREGFSDLNTKKCDGSSLFSNH